MNYLKLSRWTLTYIQKWPRMTKFYQFISLHMAVLLATSVAYMEIFFYRKNESYWFQVTHGVFTRDIWQLRPKYFGHNRNNTLSRTFKKFAINSTTFKCTKMTFFNSRTFGDLCESCRYQSHVSPSSEQLITLTVTTGASYY